MKKLCLILLSAVFCFVSCYDDSALQQSVTDLEGRVETLEQKVNANVESIANILKAIDEKNFVTEVTELKEGSKVVGYEIKLTKGNPIKIYNGESPAIGVKKDADGLYYWTVNDEWLLDGGNKIKASAQDGKNGNDGKDAVLPQVKIEDGNWWIKVEGQEWTNMGQATGDSFFKDVKVGEHEVTITLADGNAFVLPLKAKLAIEFGIPAKPLEGETVTATYTITGAAGKAQVKAICQNGWAAKITQKTYATGEIAITAPTPLTNDEIIVLVADEEQHVIMSSISWSEDQVLFTDVEGMTLTSDAGTFNLTVETNIQYNVQITEPWIKPVETKAMRTDVLEFAYEENFLQEERYNVIILTDEAGNQVAEIHIMQEKGKYTLNFVHDSGQVTSAAAEYTTIPVNVVGVNNWTAESADSWATATVTDGKLTVAVQENTGEAERNTLITIKGTENGITYSDQFYLSQLNTNAIPDLLDVEIQEDGTAKDLSQKQNEIFTKKSETLTILDKKVQGRNAAIFTTKYGQTSTSGYTFKDYSLRPFWEDGYTMEAYVMCGITPANAESKALSSTKSGGTALMIGKNNKLTFIFNGNETGTKSAWHFADSDVTPEANKWYHVIGTWDQATGIARIYINGELNKEYNFGPVKLVHNALKENSYMTIGANSSLGTYDKPTLNGGWNGGISVARIYSNPLTADEVKAAYINVLESKIKFGKLR